MYEIMVEFDCLRKAPMGYFFHDTDSIKGGEFLDQVSDY
jgi:hypothetical protein